MRRAGLGALPTLARSCLRGRGLTVRGGGGTGWFSGVGVGVSASARVRMMRRVGGVRGVSWMARVRDVRRQCVAAWRGAALHADDNAASDLTARPRVHVKFGVFASGGASQRSAAVWSLDGRGLYDPSEDPDFDPLLDGQGDDDDDDGGGGVGGGVGEEDEGGVVRVAEGGERVSSVASSVDAHGDRQWGVRPAGAEAVLEDGLEEGEEWEFETAQGRSEFTREVLLQDEVEMRALRPVGRPHVQLDALVGTLKRRCFSFGRKMGDQVKLHKQQVAAELEALGDSASEEDVLRAQRRACPGKLNRQQVRDVRSLSRATTMAARSMAHHYVDKNIKETMRNAVKKLRPFVYEVQPVHMIALSRALCEANMVSEAEEVIEAYLEQVPWEKAANFAVSAYMHTHNVSRARELTERMLSDPKSAAFPNNVADLSRAVSVFVESPREPRRALEALERVISSPTFKYDPKADKTHPLSVAFYRVAKTMSMAGDRQGLCDLIRRFAKIPGAEIETSLTRAVCVLGSKTGESPETRRALLDLMCSLPKNKFSRFARHVQHAACAMSRFEDDPFFDTALRYFWIRNTWYTSNAELIEARERQGNRLTNGLLARVMASAGGNIFLPVSAMRDVWVRATNLPTAPLVHALVQGLGRRGFVVQALNIFESTRDVAEAAHDPSACGTLDLHKGVIPKQPLMARLAGPLVNEGEALAHELYRASQQAPSLLDADDNDAMGMDLQPGASGAERAMVLPHVDQNQLNRICFSMYSPSGEADVATWIQERFEKHVTANKHYAIKCLADGRKVPHIGNLESCWVAVFRMLLFFDQRTLVREYVANLTANQFPASRQFYEKLILAATHVKDFDTMTRFFELFRLHHPFDVHKMAKLDFVVNECYKAGKIEIARDIERFRNRAVESSGDYVNALLQQGLVDKVTHTLEEYRSRNVVLPGATYEHLIHELSVRGDIASSVRLLDDIIELRVHPTPGLYSSAFSLLSTSGDLQRARSWLTLLFDDPRQAQYPPALLSKLYNLALSLFAKANSSEDISQVLQVMDRLNLPVQSHLRRQLDSA